jgi:hypothetical protein
VLDGKTLRVTTLSPAVNWSRISVRKPSKAARKPSNCWRTLGAERDAVRI